MHAAGSTENAKKNMPWQGGQKFSDKNYLENFILFNLGQKLTENFYPRTKFSENFYPRTKFSENFDPRMKIFRKFFEIFCPMGVGQKFSENYCPRTKSFRKFLS